MVQASSNYPHSHLASKIAHSSLSCLMKQGPVGLYQPFNARWNSVRSSVACRYVKRIGTSSCLIQELRAENTSKRRRQLLYRQRSSPNLVLNLDG